jgi:hypothetical protein
MGGNIHNSRGSVNKDIELQQIIQDYKYNEPYVNQGDKDSNDQELSLELRDKVYNLWHNDNIG